MDTLYVNVILLLLAPLNTMGFIHSNRSFTALRVTEVVHLYGLLVPTFVWFFREKGGLQQF